MNSDVRNTMACCSLWQKHILSRTISKQVLNRRLWIFLSAEMEVHNITQFDLNRTDSCLTLKFWACYFCFSRVGIKTTIFYKLNCYVFLKIKYLILASKNNKKHWSNMVLLNFVNKLHSNSWVYLLHNENLSNLDPCVQITN